MKALLTKIALRKAVGLYLGEHEVAVCHAVQTPLGPVKVASSSEPCTTEDVAEVIERLLTPLLGQKRHPAVAVGIANSRVFFSTRPISAGGAATPEALLQKALLSSNLSVDDLTADMLKGTINKMPIAHVAACRTKYMSNVVAMLSRLGVRPYRAEPGPCALVRMAEQKYRAPRRSKIVLRVFLGDAQGLAVLVSGGQPTAWKTFSLSPGREGFAILSTTRVLGAQQKHFGIEVNLDYAMVHGRAELHEQLQQEQLPSEIGTRVLWHDGPSLEGASTAYGLALGCLAQDTKAFDLSRTLKARAPIKEIFPWGELSFAAGLIGLMGAVLGMHSMELNRSYMALKTANRQHLCLESADPRSLKKEKKELEKKVDAMRNFIEGRVLWTTYAHDISERLPAKAELTMFQGKTGGGRRRKGGNSAFELQGKAPLEPDGSIPPEIDDFLTQLPRDPLWQRDFSPVATEITLPLAGKEVRNEVDFSIQCTAKPKATAKSGKKKK